MSSLSAIKFSTDIFTSTVSAIKLFAASEILIRQLSDNSDGTSHSKLPSFSVEIAIGNQLLPKSREYSIFTFTTLLFHLRFSILPT